MDLVSYVSAIKIDVDGLCANQEQYILRHHVKMQINKNSTTLKRWGHDFTRNREGKIFKPLSQWGKCKCQRENPSNCKLPIVFCAQSFNSTRNWLG